MNSGISESGFRTLFENATDAYFVIDATGIVDCNEMAVKILKCRSKDEVLTLHPAVLSPEFQPDGRRSQEKSQEMDGLAAQNGFHRFEWMHRKMDGEVFPVQVTINAVEIEGRRVNIAVWHDLTEIKRAEQKLRDMNTRMQNELLSAAAVQRSLLPVANLKSDRFESAWFYNPCEEVGGDSLNVFQIDENRVGLYVLDVTGHGVSAALLSVTATHLLAGFIKDQCPHKLVAAMNRHFSKEGYKDHSLTMVYGVVDLRDGSFVYTSAGHLGPIRIARDGRVEQFGGHGPPIGMLGDAEYGQDRIELKKGDRLFLISDGVYEVRNSKKMEFGVEGVYAYLKEKDFFRLPLDYAVNELARKAYQWSIPEKPDDDISIVGFEAKI